MYCNSNQLLSCFFSALVVSFLPLCYYSYKEEKNGLGLNNLYGDHYFVKRPERQFAS